MIKAPHSSGDEVPTSRPTIGATRLRQLILRRNAGERTPVIVDIVTDVASGPNAVFRSYLGVFACDRIFILTPSFDHVFEVDRNLIGQDLLKLEDKIIKQKSDSRLPLSEDGGPLPSLSPPSRHEKWKLAHLRSAGSYTSDSVGEISKRIQMGQEESPIPKKIHLSEDNHLGALHELSNIITDASVIVPWDPIIFGRDSEIPLYLHKQDVQELASGTKKLNITLI
ncbi:hypothetical protein LR48_Vigan04g077600 [Vigna angularis]|uniref:Uncharacterized protein n=1 Tax=Phaseolus angularis TaxID=3914 RepID=A0A0L9UCU5_PHAAN|nr:hypothetical protein LR48_Vigan04g077600 [Vigna angularis]